MGFELARFLEDLQVPCVVAAPGKLPRKPSDRIKTDRRDALMLARLLRRGELDAVRIPAARTRRRGITCVPEGICAGTSWPPSIGWRSSCCVTGTSVPGRSGPWDIRSGWGTWSSALRCCSRPSSGTWPACWNSSSD